ncbi:MAG: hypothetical protein O3C40_18320 [Planctomycetota bacterium]|nr:hypothetical protein [Planctomycetota bacterium]
MTAYDDRIALDDCFALMGEDVDFIGDIVHRDVPVLTYRWSKSEAIARTTPSELLRRGRDVMQRLGLTRIRSQGRHLRGDSTTGQRVKMTVMRCGKESMYMLMTAGMPGTRHQAQALNRQLASLLERPAQQAIAQNGRQRVGESRRLATPSTE